MSAAPGSFGPPEAGRPPAADRSAAPRAPGPRAAGGGEQGARATARWRTAGSPVLWLLPLIALQSLLAAAWPGPWPGAPFAPVVPTLSPALALVAFALIAGGGWTIRTAARELDWNATPVCASEPPRALVTTGPYRVSRHPMEVGAVAILAGTTIVLGSAAAAAVALAYAAWIDRVSMRAEDAALLARFGPAWRAYAGTVRRWL